MELALSTENEYLEGRHALEEAIEAGVPVQVVYASDAAIADKRCSKLLARLRSDGVAIERATKRELEERSSHGAHQGIVAQIAPYSYASLEDLVQRAAGKQNALIIACDHVTDAGNFGAIVRSAEVVGACGVLIQNKRSARVNMASYKTSAGAVAHLPVALEANLATNLERLKDEGFWIVGASEHAQSLLWDAPLSGRIVLVMGSEGSGLSKLTLKTCDLLVKLPQVGRVESLNVAQATTALAYEWMRQCNVTKS